MPPTRSTLLATAARRRSLFRRHWLGAALATAALLAWAWGNAAAMRIVVPFPPGGGNDVFARQLVHGLDERFQTHTIVENRPGTGGNLGTEMVVCAPANSGIVLLGHTGTVSINPALYAGLRFNAAKDLQPAAMFASSALLRVVPAASPIQDVAQLADALRQARSGMDYASSGAGTGGHLTREMFAHMLGVKATHVPYKGTPPSLTDLAGGQVYFSFGLIPAALALVKTGRLRALAVTSARCLAQLPDVATVAESGVRALSGFESSLTYGILAPKGTPAAEVGKLGAEILQVAASAAFQSRLDVNDAEPLHGDAAYARRIQQESSQ